MTKGKIENYFPGGNTVAGFYSLYDYLPYQASRVLIIKGGPGTGKSTFMKKTGLEMVEQGRDIEFHWCSSDNNSLDGVVIPDYKLAIFDGTAPHMIDPVNPGAVEEIVNLGEYWDSSYLYQHREKIIGLNKLIGKKFDQVYYYLRICGQIHDQLQRYYRENLNNSQAEQKYQESLNQVLADRPNGGFSGQDRHLFASAITPNGPVNYFDNLTAEIGRRFIIKGQPGTGKSSLIERIAAAVSHSGYELLYLHCGFKPTRLDGIIIPGLDTAVINGSAPHPLEARSDGDQIIDLSTLLSLGTHSVSIEEIKETENLLSDIMEKVYNHLKQAKITHDQLEEYYVKAMDFNRIEKKRKEIKKEYLGSF